MIYNKINKLSVILLLVMSIVSCKGTSTDEYLSGDFINSTNDKTPPSAILPIEGDIVFNSKAVLQWTANKDAAYYTVEITENKDADFSTQIAGSPFRVNAPDTILAIDLPTASTTYCWRVRADITSDGLYGQSFFESMDNTVYVYCPASVSTPDDTGMVGNISKPFQTIMRGIAEADRLNISKIKVASRQGGANTYYHEIIVLKDGISIFGAYSPDFSESTRDLVGNKTIIEGRNGYTIIAMNITYDTIVEGFEINGSSSNPTYAIHVSDCYTGRFIIRSNAINGRTITAYTNSSSYGICLENAGAIISDNTITSGDAKNTYGIMVNIGNPEITGNSITAGAADEGTGLGNSYGIYNNGNSIIMDNNINAEDTPAESDNSYGIYNTYGAWISENTIIGGPSTGESYGIYNTGYTCNTIVLNNLIIGGNASDSYGMNNENSSAPVLYNNTIIGGEASHNSYGLLNSGAPVTIVNNIFATFDSAGTSYGYDGSVSTHTNNCFWASSGISYDTNDLTLDKTEIEADPLFDADYKLTSKTDEQILYGAADLEMILNILAYDILGLKTYLPLDRAGRPRTSSNGWSMGAFEY